MRTHLLKTHRSWFMLVCCMGLALSLSGCSNPRNMSNSHQVKTYGHDGYMGYSNSNPNVPNSFSYLNYKSDGKFAGEVLKQVKGVKDSSITFNGQYLRAFLTVERNVSNEEMKEIQRKAQSLLQSNMPRYQVKVETGR